MAVPRARLLDLLKVQCRIFSTTYNPTCIRTGNKVLRQRLHGQSLLEYYPKEVLTFKDLENSFPDLLFINEEEERREEKVEQRKLRGKGAPKKKKTAAEGKRGKKR